MSYFLLVVVTTVKIGWMLLYKEWKFLYTHLQISPKIIVMFVWTLSFPSEVFFRRSCVNLD